MFNRAILTLLLGYTAVFHVLLFVHFAEISIARAVILMGLTLFVVWVVIGGILQLFLRKKFLPALEKPRRYPLLFFSIFAITLALIEEVITTSITNSARLYGLEIGQAYITASTNFFDVIVFHSVIVFIPMLFVLGIIGRRYTLSPLHIAALWGTCGIIAEFTLAGSQTLLNAPMWFMVYGLMVYLPAHTFVKLERKKAPVALFPIFVALILASAITTAWIPLTLDHPSIHFSPIQL